MSRPRLFPALAAAGLGLALSGCAMVGPDYRPPKPDVPDQWAGPAEPGPRDTAALEHWWERFQDPALDGLIRDALAANTDLATARANLRESRAQRNLARAGLGPSVNVSGSAGRSESGSGLPARQNYSTGFDASWEPDVFGGARRGLQAAEADLQASGEALYETRVTLVAEVARNYVELRTAERRLTIAENNLSAQRELYQLTRWRRMAGLVSDLDEAQALSLLQQTQASLPALRTAVVEARYRLAILLAKPPGELKARLKGTGSIPVASGKIAAGIPANTLRQRPDVRAAERRLAAQTARVGQAEAARYPSFNLSGSLGLAALSAGDLFTGDAVNNSLLAGITAPIFDSGRIRSNIAVQDARLEKARVAYRAAVLTALQDVENALVEVANTRQRRTQLGRAEATARQTLDLARQRYASGLADFQSVLDSQRTVLSLQDQLASSTGDYSTAVIQLYKALGGGWTPAADASAANKGSS
ncbi:MAG: efflux transporter outer membrane subunit [Gammaproteobacteria bacterium]